MMRIAYFGSPDFSAQVLESLYTIHDVEIELVVTQPDRMAGKRLIMTPTAVKRAANTHSTPYFDKDIRDPVTHRELAARLVDARVDLCILFAYSQMISDELLSIPKMGFWNIHPSLLPAYRGPSPTVYPLLMHEHKTGVTLMQLVKKMDSGPIIAQKVIKITPETTRTVLEKQCVHNAIELLTTYLSSPVEIRPTAQVEQGVSYTKKITRDDGHVSLTLLKSALQGEDLLTQDLPAVIGSFIQKNHISYASPLQSGRVVYALYRAFVGWPGIWTTVPINGHEKRLKIIDCSISEQDKLIIHTVALEGKPSVPFKSFNDTYNIFII